MKTTHRKSISLLATLVTAATLSTATVMAAPPDFAGPPGHAKHQGNPHEQQYNHERYDHQDRSHYKIHEIRRGDSGYVERHDMASDAIKVMVAGTALWMVGETYYRWLDSRQAYVPVMVSPE